jgi:hypothetical protein
MATERMHPGKRDLVRQIELEDARWAYEERAAIMEFEAGISRQEAEARSLEALGSHARHIPPRKPDSSLP